jgi:hypothetical protein
VLSNKKISYINMIEKSSEKTLMETKLNWNRVNRLTELLSNKAEVPLVIAESIHLQTQ